jgi:hypothetical protein
MEDDDRSMDAAYAILSFMAGWFAAAADEHLGRQHFISLIRESRWRLTTEMLQAWRADACALGVPVDIANEVPPRAVIDHVLPVGFQLQNAVDRRDWRG